MNVSTVRCWLVCTTNGVLYSEEQCFVAENLLYCIIVAFKSVVVTTEIRGITFRTAKVFLRNSY